MRLHALLAAFLAVSVGAAATDPAGGRRAGAELAARSARLPRHLHGGRTAARAPPGTVERSLSEPSVSALVEVAASASASAPEHSGCELCMVAVHQVQYGTLPACGGDQKKHAAYSACSQVVLSLLAYAHDVMHLLTHGCYKYSPYHGWQTVQPCPAHVVCGRLSNIFDQQKGAHCPTDFHYRLPFQTRVSEAANPLLEFAAKTWGKDGASTHPVVSAIADRLPTGVQKGAQPTNYGGRRVEVPAPEGGLLADAEVEAAAAALMAELLRDGSSSGGEEVFGGAVPVSAGQGGAVPVTSTSQSGEDEGVAVDDEEEGEDMGDDEEAEVIEGGEQSDVPPQRPPMMSVGGGPST